MLDLFKKNENYTCVLTNMCMVYDGDKILVQDRVNKNWPGLTFPGGHVEEGESFTESVIREVYDYSGQLKSSAEGEVFWIKRDALNQYKLASDFAEMVEIFERDDRSEFCYKRTKDGYKKEIY